MKYSMYANNKIITKNTNLGYVLHNDINNAVINTVKSNDAIRLLTVVEYTKIQNTDIITNTANI